MFLENSEYRKSMLDAQKKKQLVFSSCCQARSFPCYVNVPECSLFKADRKRTARNPVVTLANPRATLK